MQSYSISASSVGLKFLVSGTINRLINSWDAIRDISDEPQWIRNFDKRWAHEVRVLAETSRLPL
jgi:hypothetical protein